MSSNTIEPIHRPYKAQIHMAFPSAIHAHHIKDVVSVDGELKDNIIKTFDVVTVTDVPPAVDEGLKKKQQEIISEVDESDVEKRVLRINFEATDAKTLRVVISTTYDMINVALKCFQEFGE